MTILGQSLIFQRCGKKLNPEWQRSRVVCLPLSLFHLDRKAVITKGMWKDLTAQGAEHR